MSVLDRFWPKDELVQKTIEIESSLYDEIEFLCENVYDTSVSKIVVNCGNILSISMDFLSLCLT